MSRHRLLRPEIFEPSQFRIRASKKDKQDSNNYKNNYPRHLFNSSQFIISQDNNKYQNTFNTQDYKQENELGQKNYEFEQEIYESKQENEIEQENYEYEQENEIEQKNYESEQEIYESEQENEIEQENYESEQEIYESEQENEIEQENYESEQENPRIFDGQKYFFSNEDNSEFGPFKSFTIMAFFIWITKYMICK